MCARACARRSREALASALAWPAPRARTLTMCTNIHILGTIICIEWNIEMDYYYMYMSARKKIRRYLFFFFLEKNFARCNHMSEGYS